MINQDFFIDTQIKCPSCRKKGLININKKNIVNSSRGITAIHISKDIICEHSFVAYLDRNLVVRDSFLYDFEISLPQFEEEPKKKERDYTSIDIGVIKLNILPTSMINILRGIILGKKLVIIINDDFLIDLLHEFFNMITEDSFKLELTIFSRKEYIKHKKEFSEHIILDNRNIINDKKKIIDTKKKYIESKIVNNFYSEMDPVSSLILLKNEIFKLYKFSKALIEYNEGFDETNKYVINHVFEHFNKLFCIDLQKYYLDFIEEIVENYFQIKLNKSPKATNFLGML